MHACHSVRAACTGAVREGRRVPALVEASAPSVVCADAAARMRSATAAFAIQGCLADQEPSALSDVARLLLRALGKGERGGPELDTRLASTATAAAAIVEHVQLLLDDLLGPSERPPTVPAQGPHVEP